MLAESIFKTEFQKHLLYFSRKLILQNKIDLIQQKIACFYSKQEKILNPILYHQKDLVHKKII